MRVEGLSNLQAAIRANVADLMGRLEPGDVVKAKVLEISSGEALLRLFDGSVLKAAIGEGLQAQAGQTLTLAVASKSEGTLFLETVKDSMQNSPIKQELLKNLLSALNLKPDTLNTELASEFLKAGIKPTSEQFHAASAMLKEAGGLSAEKAVFLASKGIQPDPAKLELLSRLLDGGLKLGNQLDDLQSALENILKASGKAIPSNSTGNGFLEAAMSAAAEKSPAGTGMTAQGGVTQAADDGTQTQQQRLQQQSQGTASQLNVQADAASRENSGETMAGLLKASGNAEGKAAATAQSATAASTAAQNTAASNSAQNATAASAQTPNLYENDALNAENSPQTASRQQAAVSNNAANASAQAATAADKELAAQSGIIRQLAADAEEPGNSGNFGKAGASSDSFSSIKDAIKDVFVRLDTDKSAEGLELGKSHKELGERLELVKSAIQHSGLTGLSGRESIAAATGQIDDSMRLMSQLNSSNVYYYQIPVNLAGRNTTAELFVMKREPGKKKIDPNNSVLFISLDTDHLGRFESLIDVKGKNVTVNFRTEKQEINDFIKENIKYLYSGLSDSGYKLVDTRYALIDSATPPTKLEQVLSKMAEASRAKVDLRI
jgi:hypothetical protein